VGQRHAHDDGEGDAEARLRPAVHVRQRRNEDLQARMSMTHLLRPFSPGILATITLLVLAASGDARAEDPKVQCPAASERGQRLRDDGKYVEARDSFRECARAECPAVVRKDCTKWVGEVEDSIPSLVFSAADTTGNDVTTARVLVDGVLVSPRLEGKPVQVDP